MKNKTRRVKEVMGPLGKKFKRPKKRELGFYDIALRSHVDYLIEPFSQPFFFDILKKNWNSFFFYAENFYRSWCFGRS